MLAEPDRTPYDLKFRLFRFPVRVHPWFWIAMLVLAAGAEGLGALYLLVWVGVAFVSILVHELGHALAFRCFGVDSHIVLYAFGGLAVPWSTLAGRWRRIVVALAGPAAGFLLYGAVYGSNYFYPWVDRQSPLILWWLYFQLIFVNLWWGLLNLLPIWPLDGGQVSEEVCTYLAPRTGRQLALQISIVLAGAMCLYAIACVLGDRQSAEWIDALPGWVPRGSLWTAILFGMLAANGYQRLQQVKWTESHWDHS